MPELDAVIDSLVAQAQLEAGVPSSVIAARGNERLALLHQSSASPVKSKRAGWSKAEDEIFRANASLPDKELAKMLGRSEHAILMRRLRALRLPVISKAADILTAEHIGNGLGIDGKSVALMMTRGILPFRFLPWKKRLCRVVDRVTFLRWLTNPMNWAYLDLDKVGTKKKRGKRGIGVYDAEFWAKARKLLGSKRAKWGDEWWTPGQVAAWHGMADPVEGSHYVSKAIRAGRLPAVKWGNWKVLKSDATRPGFQLTTYKKKGGGMEDHAYVSPNLDAFLVLGHAIGFSHNALGAMSNRSPKWISYRLKCIRNWKRIPKLMRSHNLAIQYNVRTHEVFADWHRFSPKFKNLASAMVAFQAGCELTNMQLRLVRGVLATWLKWHASTSEQRGLLRSLYTLGKRKTSHYRIIYEQLKRWGIDPLLPAIAE